MVRERQITRENMRAVRERWRCPENGCDGEMKFNGTTFDMLPAAYEHTCDECDFTTGVSGEKYPRITHVPVEDVEATDDQ